MHIAHALFTPRMGGLEASYMDTTEALLSKGYRVTALMRDDAPYRLNPAWPVHLITARPTGFYDVVTAWKIRRKLLRLKPDLVIAHNARAISLMRLALIGTEIPVCGVTHSYKTARTMRADRLVVLTQHMRDHFIAAGYAGEHIHIMPNLIRTLLPFEPKPRSVPIAIGTLGRFTVDKGFGEFLKALEILKQKNVYFSAYIGGQGIELGALHLLAEKLGLSSHIVWEGWVKDKTAFYRKLDIFCLPSLEESFGIVVLEALAHAIPVVATDVSGPLSIITHEVDGLLVPSGDAQAIADAMERIIDNVQMARDMAQAGCVRAKDFSFESVAQKWDETVQAIASSLKTDPLPSPEVAPPTEETHVG